MSEQRPSDFVPDEVWRYYASSLHQSPNHVRNHFNHACRKHNFDPFAVVRWPDEMTDDQLDRFFELKNSSENSRIKTGYRHFQDAYREFAAEQNAELDKPKVPRPDASAVECDGGAWCIKDDLGDVCQYLHSDGEWRNSLLGQGKFATALFLEEHHAQAALDKWREENPNG